MVMDPQQLRSSRGNEAQTDDSSVGRKLEPRYLGCYRPSRQRGALSAEMLIAIALLMIALLPLAYSFVTEKRLARSYYQRAIAMEIVDGEMEVLAAGEWHSFTPGQHDYPVRSAARTNLPPGRFQLEVQTNRVRLEWQPSVKMQGGPVFREVKVQ